MGGGRVRTRSKSRTSNEWIAGFAMLECADLDEAIEMAAKIPAAKRGTIEVRPIWQLPAGYAMTGGGGAS